MDMEVGNKEVGGGEDNSMDTESNTTMRPKAADFFDDVDANDIEGDSSSLSNQGNQYNSNNEGSNLNRKSSRWSEAGPVGEGRASTSITSSISASISEAPKPKPLLQHFGNKIVRKQADNYDASINTSSIREGKSTNSGHYDPRSRQSKKHQHHDTVSEPIYKRLQVGDSIMALYRGDGNYYLAVVRAVIHGGYWSANYDVEYEGYGGEMGNVSWQEVQELSKDNRNSNSSSSSSSVYMEGEMGEDENDGESKAVGEEGDRKRGRGGEIDSAIVERFMRRDAFGRDINRSGSERKIDRSTVSKVSNYHVLLGPIQHKDSIIIITHIILLLTNYLFHFFSFFLCFLCFLLFYILGVKGWDRWTN